MASNIDVNRIVATFLRYAVPSVVSMVISGIFVIIDGIFLGQATGDLGLAAINIAFPFYTISSALGIGIGCGGAVLMSMCLGAGKMEDAEKYLGNTIFLMIAAAIFVSIISFVFCNPLLRFFGASDAVFKFAYDYASVVIFGSIFIIFGTGLLPLIRNDGNPKKCMLITVIGLLTNIFLDWLFIIYLNGELFGAALATVIGQALTGFLGILHFYLKKSNVKLKKENFKFNLNSFKKIVVVGSSPFGINTAIGCMTIMFNWQSLHYGGDTGVAAFCTILYALAPFRLMLEGIGDGLQPITSFYHGGGFFESERRTFRTAIMFAFLIGFCAALTLYFASDTFAYIFGAGKEAGALISSGAKIIAFAFLFLPVVKVSSAYFYSIGKTKYATLLIYGDTFFAMPLCLIVFPMIFKINGVWLSYTCTYFFMAIAASIMVFRSRKNVIILLH